MTNTTTVSTLATEGASAVVSVEGLPAETDRFSNIRIIYDPQFETAEGTGTIVMKYRDKMGNPHTMLFGVIRSNDRKQYSVDEKTLFLRPERPRLVRPQHRDFWETNANVKIVYG